MKILVRQITNSLLLMIVVGCTPSSTNSPDLFTKEELMAFDETGRAPRVLVAQKEQLPESAQVAEEMRVETPVAIPHGDDPVAVVIAADEERKKIEDIRQEPKIEVESKIEVAQKVEVIRSKDETLSIDQSYWKPRPVVVGEEESSAVVDAGIETVVKHSVTMRDSDLEVVMSQESFDKERFSVSPGSDSKLHKWFVLNSPRRLVLDFNEAVGAGFSTKHILPMDSKHVAEVRLGTFEGKSRVVLELASSNCEPEVVSGQGVGPVEVVLCSGGKG